MVDVFFNITNIINITTIKYTVYYVQDDSILYIYVVCTVICEDWYYRRTWKALA